MLQQTVFGLSVAFSFVAWSIVARDFVWPALNGRSRADALRPLLILHSFRFVGLSFLIPGVVSPDLPVAFAAPAAYGDLNCVACPIVNRIVRCHHAQRVPILARRGMANEFERFLHYNSASRFPRTDHPHAQPHSMDG